MANELNFGTAFKYPFNRPVGMLNILWILLPIIGWFALFGYAVDIVNEFLKNNFKELPKMDFNKDLSLGFFMFFKGLPFFLALIVVSMVFGFIPILGIIINIFIGIFIVPVLAINFMKKQTVDSFFEFKKLKYVFGEIEEYVVAIVKSLGLGIIFLLMWLILVGIPAGAFTKNIFIADFYRRFVK